MNIRTKKTVFQITVVLCGTLAIFLLVWGWNYSIRTAATVFDNEWKYNDARGKSPLAAHDEAVLTVIFRPLMICGGLLLIPYAIASGIHWLLFTPSVPSRQGKRRYQKLSKAKRIMSAFGGAIVFTTALTMVALCIIAWQQNWQEWRLFPSSQDYFFVGAIILALVLIALRLPLGDFWVIGGGILLIPWIIFWGLICMQARSDPHWNGDPILGGIFLLSLVVCGGPLWVGLRLNRFIDA